MHLKVLFVLLRYAYCVNKLFGEENLEEYDGYLKQNSFERQCAQNTTLNVQFS